MSTITKSDIIQYSDDGLSTSAALIWVKLKSITMLGGYTGSWRIYFQLSSNFTGSTAYGKVYKNGVPYGGEFSQFLISFIDCIQDFDPINISKGDTIELWGRVDSHMVWLRNFRIEFDGPYGDVEFTSTPSGAEIFVDNVDTGQVTTSTIIDLTPGSHDYKLTRDGYANSTGSINVLAIQEITVNEILSDNCPISPKYEGDNVHLSANPRSGIGPYYVEFRKTIEGSTTVLNSYTSSPENTEITYDYILTNEDIRTAYSGTINFSVYMEDSCPTTPQTCSDSCAITIGCYAPVCNFTVA